MRSGGTSIGKGIVATLAFLAGVGAAGRVLGQAPPVTPVTWRPSTQSPRAAVPAVSGRGLAQVSPGGGDEGAAVSTVSV